MALPIGAIRAAEIKVISSASFKPAFNDLATVFEKQTNDKVSPTWSGTVGIPKKIAAGEIFDVVIIWDPTMDALGKDGRLIAGTRIPVAKSASASRCEQGPRRLIFPQPRVVSLAPSRRSERSAETGVVHRTRRRSTCLSRLGGAAAAGRRRQFYLAKLLFAEAGATMEHRRVGVTAAERSEVAGHRFNARPNSAADMVLTVILSIRCFGGAARRAESKKPQHRPGRSTGSGRLLVEAPRRQISF